MLASTDLRGPIHGQSIARLHHVIHSTRLEHLPIERSWAGSGLGTAFFVCFDAEARRRREGTLIGNTEERRSTSRRWRARRGRPSNIKSPNHAALVFGGLPLGAWAAFAAHEVDASDRARFRTHRGHHAARQVVALVASASVVLSRRLGASASDYADQNTAVKPDTTCYRKSRMALGAQKLMKGRSGFTFHTSSLDDRIRDVRHFNEDRPLRRRQRLSCGSDGGVQGPMPMFRGLRVKDRPTRRGPSATVALERQLPEADFDFVAVTQQVARALSASIPQPAKNQHRHQFPHAELSAPQSKPGTTSRSASPHPWPSSHQSSILGRIRAKTRCPCWSMLWRQAPRRS